MHKLPTLSHGKPPAARSNPLAIPLLADSGPSPTLPRRCVNLPTGL